MPVETGVSYTELALEVMPEFFSGEVTETDLPVREMLRPIDSVTVFSSAYSPVETITKLPQAENFEAKPMSWLEGITRNKKEVAAAGIIFATQTAFSGSSFGVGIVGGGMLGMGFSEFIKPLLKHGNDRAAAGCLITVGGAVIGGIWGESAQITQALPFVTFEAMVMMAIGLGGFFGVRSLAEKWLVKSQDIIPLPPQKINLKVQKGEVKEPKINLKVPKGDQSSVKMKIKLKD